MKAFIVTPDHDNGSDAMEHIVLAQDAIDALRVYTEALGDTFTFTEVSLSGRRHDVWVTREIPVFIFAGPARVIPWENFIIRYWKGDAA